MTGDNGLHLGVICRQSVEEADFVWAVCVRDCTGLWIGSADLPESLSGSARHAVAVGASARASCALRD